MLARGLASCSDAVTGQGSQRLARGAACSTPIVARRRCSNQLVCRAQKLPAGLQKIVVGFQMVPDPMARYKQLLYYATKLPAMPAADHTPANKVEGCVSQVWVKPELRDNGRVYWTADSDSQLTKGLAALLVLGLSDCTAEEILKVDGSFIEALGLKQSLTPSRNNGFLNMLRLMQRKALELIGDGPGAQEAASSSGSTAGRTEAATAGGSTAVLTVPVLAQVSAQNAVSGATVASSAHSQLQQAQAGAGGPQIASAGVAVATLAPGASAVADALAPGASAAVVAAAGTLVGTIGDLSPSSTFETVLSSEEVQRRMRQKLTEALRPSSIYILDESPEPKQSRQSIAKGLPLPAPRELHFRLEIVSPEFEGMSSVKRQRRVYQIVADEFKVGLHALSLVTKAPSELSN